MGNVKSNLVDKAGAVVATIVTLFSDVILTLSDNDAVYPGSRGSGPSTTVLEFTVGANMVGGEVMGLSNRVYARLQPDGKLKIDVSIPKGIKLSPAMRDALKAHVNTAISKWADREKAFRAAHTRLTTPPSVKDSKAAVTAEPIYWQPEAEAAA
jgi:hypothetical protein